MKIFIPGIENFKRFWDFIPGIDDFLDQGFPENRGFLWDEIFRQEGTSAHTHKVNLLNFRKFETQKFYYAFGNKVGIDPWLRRNLSVNGHTGFGAEVIWKFTTGSK